MLTSTQTIDEILKRLPDADKPGHTSKLTAPPRGIATQVAEELLAGGRDTIMKLAGMVRDGFGNGKTSYRPGYALRCVTLHVGAEDRETERKLVSDCLTSRLGDDAMSSDAQCFLIRELQLVAGVEAVGPLLKHLDNPALGDTITLALGAIRGGAAELSKRLENVPKSLEPSVLQALGRIADKSTLPAVQRLATSKDPQTRMAAGWALSRLGDARGARTLLGISDRAKGHDRQQLTKACLVLAERLAHSGDKKTAGAICKHLIQTRTDPSEAYVADAAKRLMAARE